MSYLIHPSAQQGFSKDAKLYQQARPNYPHQIVDWMQQQLLLDQNSQVIDLGAGTGKFIPYLQEVTSNIYAVEPIQEMLEQLQQQFPEVKTLQTDSKNLSLASDSIDAVFCAQSFHWFANAESMDEIYHVLKPKGHLVLIWNQRDISIPWVKAIADLIAPLEGDTPRFHNGLWQTVFAENDQFQLQSKQHFQFLHHGTIEQVLINRVLSTSFIAATTSLQKEIIRSELLKIVDQYLKKDLQDSIDFPYLTHIYHYQKI